MFTGFINQNQMEKKMVGCGSVLIYKYIIELHVKIFASISIHQNFNIINEIAENRNLINNKI